MTKKFTPPEFDFKFAEGFEAYDYQQEAFNLTLEHMRTSTDPAYIYGSVSSGKSLMIAMLAKHFQNVRKSARLQGFTANHKVLMIVRTGELVQQNADEAWGIKCENSIFCAGLGIKSLNYDCVMGSEKSLYNALHKEMKDFVPTIILIDESHMLNYEDSNTQMMKMINEFRERNKNVRIIGLTGSPWRGKERILDGGFWKKEIARYDREYLTKRGFVMPCEFGFGDSEAHYSAIGEDEYKPDYEGDSDLSKKELEAMEKKILADGTTTQKIMLDITKVMKNRNIALITCAGQKHCKEAAKYLPDGSYAIITEKTSTKDRLDIKERCNRGELKYVLQIGCWTVGVSIPRIDTIVIMRLIGSMTLYEQLLGRGVRLLKDEDKKAGVVKNECLVMDYTDTSAVMSSLFSSDELDQAEKKRAKDAGEDMVICPKCGHENSPRARRCSHIDDNGNRCDYFFSYKRCEDMYDFKTGKLIKKGCGVKNDPSARVCRGCGGYMVDPNEKLNNQHYSKDDLILVKKFDFGLTKDKSKILVQYRLENGKRAREMFDIKKKEKWIRGKWNAFLKEHVLNKADKQKLYNCYSPEIAMQFNDAVRAPVAVTHRVDSKGFDILAKKAF